MTNEKNAKNAEVYVCQLCDFQCSKQSNYTIHLSTAKHLRLLYPTNNTLKNAKIYKCICGNEYKHNPSLYKHKKTCGEIADVNYKNKIIEDLLKQNNELKEIILEQKEVFIEQIEYNKQLLGIAKEQKELAEEQKELAKEQKYISQDQAEEQQEHNKKILELAKEQKYLAQDQAEEQQEHNKKVLELAQEQKELTIEQAEQTKILMEQIKEKGLGGTIINNTTTNNNTFNLNNYLTVTCKDAMNLKELIELVNQYDIPNKLIEMFEHGTHSSGVNRVMDEILNEIPVNKRPIHCSDLKREVLHIKSNDLWEKEDSNGAKLLAISFIDHIKHRVFGETLRWKNDVLNPNSDKDDDRYTRVLTQMMGPNSKTEAFVREKEKIKGHLAKKTLISKM